MLTSKRINAWFSSQQWQPFEFQLQTWQAIANRKSGLLHAGTGMSKTYAAWLGALQYCLSHRVNSHQSLQLLWITPLRALSVDTELALRKPVDELKISRTIETRTSDTPNKIKARQNRRLPNTLITTPESLILLLSRAMHNLLLHSLKS